MGFVFAALLISACDTPAGTPSVSDEQQTATSPSATADPTATEQPSPTPVANPVPSELLGSWEAEIVPRVGGFAPTATLRFTEGSYHIVRDPDISSGTVAVEGDEMWFSTGSVCQVEGTYRWTLEDEVLTFEVLSDSCPGRNAVLDGQEYRR